MENNSTLEKVLQMCNRKAELLQLVGTTFDSKVAFLRRMWKKNLIILKNLQKKVWLFLYYLFVVVDILIVKYQLKVNFYYSAVFKIFLNIITICIFIEQ